MCGRPKSAVDSGVLETEMCRRRQCAKGNNAREVERCGRPRYMEEKAAEDRTQTAKVEFECRG